MKAGFSSKVSRAAAINLSDVPIIDTNSGDEVRGGPRIGSRFSDREIAAAQRAAKKQKKNAAVQNLDGSSVPVGQKPKLETSFASIDAADCCDDIPFAATVPPDPDLAVGPDYVIAVVNVAFEIYDKQGNSLTGGPVGFSQFFDPTIGGTLPGTPTPGCPAYTGGLFDPDVLYDAEADRFILGIDGGGTDFCIAVSQTGDPTGAWDRYAFAADVNNAFFDFPHMGLGESEIFVGSNQFGGALPFGFQGRVFAVDKDSLYNGGPLLVATREVAPPGLEGASNFKLDGTPQPAQTPTGPAHYIMTEFFDGVVHSVYSWEDPFGADIFTLVGDVDLATAVWCPMPELQLLPDSDTAKGFARAVGRE